MVNDACHVCVWGGRGRSVGSVGRLVGRGGGGGRRAVGRSGGRAGGQAGGPLLYGVPVWSVAGTAGHPEITREMARAPYVTTKLVSQHQFMTSGSAVYETATPIMESKCKPFEPEKRRMGADYGVMGCGKSATDNGGMH